jgi:hypothetical protein
MSSLPIKKIYCDTKFRRFDSKSTSDFKIDLPQTLKLPDNCVCYIDDVSIPRTWYTVESNVNDKLYFRLQFANGGAYYDYIITLDSREYTGNQFATEIQSKITAVTSGAATTAVYDAPTRKMSVAVVNQDINFFTDEELKDLSSWGASLGTAGVYDSNNLKSGNELLTNVFPNVVGNITNPAKYNLNLTPVRNIYMRSPNISSFNTIGCNGESSIIKKIPVTAAPGEMITSFITSSTDFIPCNSLTLKTIEIQLHDVHGNPILLHGSNWSFSILFDLMNSDQ